MKITGKILFLLIFAIFLLSTAIHAQDSLNVRVISKVLSGPYNDIFKCGNYCYAGGGSRLSIIDVSNPARPIEVGHYYVPFYISDIFVVDTLAYVTDLVTGLHIINVSNPAMPHEVGSFTSRWGAYEVQIVGDYAYLAGIDGLITVSYTHLTLPTICSV